MRTTEIHEQLNAVFLRSGWSIPELLKKSGLPLDRIQLWRRLKGVHRFTFEEAGTIAATFTRHGFECVLVWPKAKRKRAA